MTPTGKGDLVTFTLRNLQQRTLNCSRRTYTKVSGAGIAAETFQDRSSDEVIRLGSSSQLHTETLSRKEEPMCVQRGSKRDRYYTVLARKKQ